VQYGKAGLRRPFLYNSPPYGGSVECGKKIFVADGTKSPTSVLWRCWLVDKNMRAFALGLILSGVALPCAAQTALKSEPLMLAPYEIAFVQSAACPAGQVLKVTGAIRGLHRKKVCVTIGLEQATLSAATP
jgi:hypothetical protein